LGDKGFKTGIIPAFTRLVYTVHLCKVGNQRALSWLTEEQENVKKASDKKEAGNEAYKDRNYKEALENYNEAMECLNKIHKKNDE
jgi:hypothetical protein